MRERAARMRLRNLAAAAVVGSLFAACDSAVSPNGDKTYVRGDVADTAFRPLSGARIEVLDGPHAGATASSNGIGGFELAGTASGSVRLRASRGGFQAATIDTVWQREASGGWASIRLQPVEPALAIEPGRYTLTVISDQATATGRPQAPCEGFPADMTTRTFEGTIQVSTSLPSAYEFSALSSDSTLRSPWTRLVFGVAGQFVGFESEDPIFSEESSGFRYLQILGSAPTSAPATSTGTSITVPFHGDFWYCQLTSPMSANNCSQVPRGQIVDYRSCASVNDMLVFTKQ